MSHAQALGQPRGELRKLTAFLRRDLLVAWSYRFSFITDGLGLFAEAIAFSFVGRMVDPSTLPSFGGTRGSYMAFVAIGITLTQFLQVGLGQMVRTIRAEQLMGTLESLILSPSRYTTLLLGSVAYELLVVPIRATILLGVLMLSFGVSYEAAGVLPAVTVLLFFLPFIWGLGIIGAAGVLTFRKGTGAIGLAAYGMTLLSGAYFPTDLLPGWLAGLAKVNPIAVALDAGRSALIGGAGWADISSDLATLGVAAVISIALGMVALRLAIRRERRLGTIGIY